MTTRSGIVETIGEQGMPLAEYVEAGVGFRIGATGSAFSARDTDDGSQIYVAAEAGLEVRSQVERHGQAVMVSSTLRNTAGQASEAIDVLAPLYLVFRHPSEQWRHVYGLGGTTQGFYPPLAYRTQECSRSARSAFSIESHPEGRSSNLHLPMLISLTSHADDSDGLFCGMEWSGAWYMRFEQVADNRSALAMGVMVNGLTLEAGEELRLPTVHLGLFTGGKTAGTNHLRRHLREHVCAEYEGRQVVPRVSYDHWFGIGDGLDDNLMRAEARQAAKLGVETFVVDAGWFAGGFSAGVGNWDTVDTAKFPEGLEPLAVYVRELGMDFGLWFEPERAMVGTSIQRDNPDWFVQVKSAGRPKPEYHINLSNRKAQDGLIELLGGWIERLDIRWSRWDYNIEPAPFWNHVDPSGKLQFAYYEGLYRVLDVLMARFPKWMVEGCASGGRRLDLGTMRRAHTFWFSDHTTDPWICRYMQMRANHFMPGHLLNSSVAVKSGAGDACFDKAAILSRMGGKLAFDGDIASWSDELVARMAGWVQHYKAIRHLVAQCYYPLMAMPRTAKDWDGGMFVSYDQSEAAVLVFAGLEGGRRSLPLQGLDPARDYDVNAVATDTRDRRRGAQLLGEGLPVELEAGDAGLWHIAAC